MKKLFTCLALIFFLIQVQAQWDKSKFIQSKTIDELKLKFNAANSIDYDHRGISKTLDSVNYFQVKDQEIRIYTEFLNPLKYRIKSSTEIVPDKLIDKAQDYLTNVIGVFGAFKTGSPSVDSTGQFLIEQKAKDVPEAQKIEISISDPQLLELVYLMQANNLQDKFISKSGEATSNFAVKLVNVKFEETKESIVKELEKIFNAYYSASNRESALKANENATNSFIIIQEKLVELKQRSDDFKASFDALEIDATSINNLLIKSKADSFIQEIDQFITQVKTDISNRYKPIQDLFNQILTKPVDDGDIEIVKAKGLKTGSNQKVALTIEVLDYKKETGEFSVKSSERYEIHFRRYNLFIPVVTAGIFYTDVSFSSFGTSTNESGETVVAQVDNSSQVKNELAALAHINFYLNIEHLRGAFLQMGVGPSKELPLLTLGGGVEVLNRINISAGVAWTWQPTLGSLTEGDVVTGTAQIEEDLKYEFDNNPKFYLGISVNLTK